MVNKHNCTPLQEIGIATCIIDGNFIKIWKMASCMTLVSDLYQEFFARYDTVG